MKRPARARAPAAAALATLALVVVTALAGLAVGCGSSEPADQVTLQLNWFHQAEFVGYYAAETKGFYHDQGIDVTFLEGGPGKAGGQQVLDGTATFAITTFAVQREMVVNRQPAVSVMAVFQIPPLVIFSLAESNISEPADLMGKRVGVTTNYHRNILRETLAAAGVDTIAVTEVDVKPGQMQLLYDGTVDSWVGYAPDEPIKARVAGHPVSNIFPADYGIGGYEGLLITLESTIAQQPDLTKRFVQASYEGWRYALEHQDEAAQILTTWAPENGLEFQKLAVHAVAPLVDIPQVPVGWIDAARWQQLMGDDFDETHPGYTMQFSPVQP